MTMTLDGNVSDVKETADTPPASPYGSVVSVEPATYIQKGGKNEGNVHTLSTAEKLVFEDGTVRYRCKRCGTSSKLYENVLSIRPHGIVHRNGEAPVTPPMSQGKRGRSTRTRLAPQIEELLIAQIDGAVKDATKELTQERDAWKARALDSEMKLAKLRAALTSL